MSQTNRKHTKYKSLHKVIEPDDRDFTYKQVIQIQYIYIIAAIIWLIIVYCLCLYTGGVVVCLFLFIPLIVYGLNFYWLPQHTKDVPKLMFDADFLAIAFLIITLIVNWYKLIDTHHVLPIIIVAVIILAFTLIDFWTPKKDFIIIQHIRSSLETAAVVLLMIVAYKYYLLMAPLCY